MNEEKTIAKMKQGSHQAMEVCTMLKYIASFIINVRTMPWQKIYVRKSLWLYKRITHL